MDNWHTYCQINFTIAKIYQLKLLEIKKEGLLGKLEMPNGQGDFKPEGKNGKNAWVPQVKVTSKRCDPVPAKNQYHPAVPDYFDFLREDQSRFYDALPLGYITLDKTGKIKSANNTAAAMLGRTKETFLNTLFADYVHNDDKDKLTFGKDIVSHLSPRPLEIRLHNGKQVFWASITVFSDEIFFFYYRQVKIIFCDINELKQTREENNKLKQILQQTQKMEAVGELSCGIVHDFNNLLHPMIGSLENLMEDTANNRNLNKTIKNVLDGANRASSLVGQILTISHKTDFDVKPVRIQPIVREALKLSRSTMPSTIKIIQTIDNDCKPVVADPTHIHQIVMNLITNAVHAMEQVGGVLDVRLNQIEIVGDITNPLKLIPGFYACLSISDTGNGIDVAIKNKIFEPLFTTKEKGTGLGLPVISGIVEKYGGKICFSSDPGKGSLFQVYIPLNLTASHVHSFVHRNQKGFYGCESILLVDDDPFIVDVQKETLENHGYVVTSFIDSISALNKFKTNSKAYDLVICDMTMPVLTGLTLAIKLKQVRQDIPVIICTGYSEQINEDNYKDMGVDGYLMKPVKKTDTLKLIRHLLDNQ